MDRSMDPGTQASTHENSAAPGLWSRKNAAVVRALAYIAKRRGKITAPRLVEWDDRNGRHLFQWDDALGAVAHRLYQARVFLNSFNEDRDGVRVKGFQSITADDGERAYYGIRRVIADDDLRARAIDLVVGRSETQLRTLKFWKLTPEQRAPILERLDAAMAPE